MGGTLKEGATMKEGRLVTLKEGRGYLERRKENKQPKIHYVSIPQRLLAIVLFLNGKRVKYFGHL